MLKHVLCVWEIFHQKSWIITDDDGINLFTCKNNKFEKQITGFLM